MQWLSDLCKEHNVWCHVGRVNTLRRLNLVLHCGANSFDGSGIVRYLPTLKLLSMRLMAERNQLRLFESYNMEYDFLCDWLKKRRKL